MKTQYWYPVPTPEGYFIESETEAIAKVINPRQKQKANLLAAAPKLLEALEELLAAESDMLHRSDWLPGEKVRRLERSKDAAVAAIAQAKGQK